MPQEKVYKTSKRHFTLFCNEVRKFIDIFGLAGWEVYFEHKQYLSTEQAVCITDQQGRTCTIALSTQWIGLKPTDSEVRKAAFHEVCELLLSRLNTFAKDRFVRESQIDEESHNIIRILERVLWQKYH
ncbi:MAG: hypothetical protein JSV01_05120, partial [Desulfobacterales bacterium]